MPNAKSRMRCFKVSILFLLCMLLLGVNAAVAKKEILVGTHLPLSGMLASIGSEQRWAYEAAVADINKAGGVFVKELNKKLPVNLIVIDDESDPGKAAAAVERLIRQRKVDLLLSGHSAPFGVIPGCVSAEKYRKYYHATACFIPPWLEHNFKWSTLLFFDMVESAAIPFEMFNSLDSEDRPKRLAAFMEDTFDGRALGGVIKEQAQKYGYDFAMDIALSPGARDYSAQILRAKNAGIDAILLFASVTDSVTLIRQMKENQFSVKYLHGWKGTWPAEFWDALGKDAQYVITDGHWSMNYPYPGAKELGERYYERFNKHSVAVGAFYALAEILWQAIEKAGSLDPAKVRQAVLDHSFSTVLGEIDYDQRGVGVYPSPAFQWIDGKQMTIHPPNLANQSLELAKPWDQR